jgi:heme-degrading monooxygenase HmoA
MIIRTWRARALVQKAVSYEDHFREEVLPKLQGIAGFRGAQLLRRTHAGEAGSEEVEFLVLTRWDSLDTVRKFAGEHLDRAVVDPAAQAVLTEFDSVVRHYDVIVEAS